MASYKTTVIETLDGRLVNGSAHKTSHRCARSSLTGSRGRTTVLRSRARALNVSARLATDKRNTSPAAPRTRLDKSVKLADPIPQAGIDRATELMQTGRLFRFDIDPTEVDEVSNCEMEVAQYTGFSYAVGMNSCGSAIFLALKAMGVQPGDKVLSNAFTFTAVPSAIVHASGEPVYVDCEENYTLDLEDLERKMQSSGAKWLVVSHMRGKLSDMDGIAALCEKYQVRFMEDCAHSLGVLWDGKHSGHHGEIACISAQSYKLINSGEGGFALTNNDDLAAKLIMFTGAYEKLYHKHALRPEDEVFESIKRKQIPPNYSMRMTNVTAACIYPQIATIEERVERYNRRYEKVESELNAIPHISVPKQLHQVRPCCDTIQFNLKGLDLEQTEAFIGECEAHGVKLDIFGHVTNARNFRNWTYAEVPEDCTKTEEIIKFAVDCRLPAVFEDKDFDVLCQVIRESMEAVTTAPHVN
mmetsp:Transcript_15498/g.18665  ORF Transcript_15498/g.18665 Transcript_15498/m.18665 type:complete len:471 (-) Transcript_15498:303-1715(-)|eukprot:CAMPEP_0197844458 /NCGR_PEP_ID=MMETSP1438-20131217/1439_1 /TAXON_ID=1461541 /ORGANISM="Pterosperma sp., Strain CCMP1384" /LENGTH=470 /DNA_ID=CAMNT_0043455241 /DNA_START=380 /DNA_END=1792 /DNA_ORIENTATION=+